MGILACQQGPLLRKLPGGRVNWGEGPLACEQGPLLPGFFGGGLGGRGSKRPCSQARTGKGFASQHNVFFLSFLP